MAEEEDEADPALGLVLEGLHAERFRRVLQGYMNGRELADGQASWRGRDRFTLRGTFSLLELTRIYCAARDCYPAGTIEGRRARGEMPEGW